MGNSFSSQDYINAKEAFAHWQGSIDETVDEFILRQRKKELRQLVRKVIQNELSDFDKTIAHMRWYRNLTQPEIAEALGIDRTTVSRHLEKINETVYEKLKYAIEYRYGESVCKQSRLIIKNTDALSCRIKSEDISGRIIKLREEQCFSTGEVSRLTGIAEERLEEIENQGKSLTMAELKRLCTFYRCSSDHILFGT